MTIPDTWVLVADRARARLFAASKDGARLAELEDLVNPEGRMKAQEIERARPAHEVETVPGHQRPLEPQAPPKAKVAERFARTLRDVLERGRVERRYEQLVLVAPPQFLGTLNHVLSREIRTSWRPTARGSRRCRRTRFASTCRRS
jgi:protein required for attachment to host cells